MNPNHARLIAELLLARHVAPAQARTLRTEARMRAALDAVGLVVNVQWDQVCDLLDKLNPEPRIPTAHNAARRDAVRLPDGRTARLLWCPGNGPNRHGTKAKVMIPSGAVLTFPAAQLVVLDEATA